MAGGKGFIFRTFTSNSMFTVPAGVSQLLLIGCGGGQSGQAGWGTGGQLSSGGKSTIPALRVITVTPNTTYTITIGYGGPPTSVRNGSVGSSGGDTTFGGLATFYGAFTIPANSDANTGVQPSPGNTTQKISYGWQFAAGAYNGTVFPYYGGAGGGAGITGPGGAGGGGTTEPNGGGDGVAAGATNYGAGGGAGGSDPGGLTGGGIGAAGAPGFLTVLWVEG